jgi:hypothetical protein
VRADIPDLGLKSSHVSEETQHGNINNRSQGFRHTLYEKLGETQAGGWFDPEEFDPVTATKSMKKGLPDWRESGRGE